MALQLTPYASYENHEITVYPFIPPTCTHPGQVQGVYIALHPNMLEEMETKITRWFADREEVEIVDVGTSDKAGLGFILMEWIECDIDPLFIAILHEEEAVGDFTLYGRALSEED